MGCTDCDGQTIPDVSKTIEVSCTILVNAHMGVRELYRSLVRVTPPGPNRDKFTDAANKHDRMARESAEIVLPDLEEAKSG